MCGSELVIEGEVAGTITSTGTLTIGAHGKVTGDIETTGVIKVDGEVNGSITGARQVLLGRGGSAIFGRSGAGGAAAG